jgi:hypothetical protein
MNMIEAIILPLKTRTWRDLISGRNEMGCISAPSVKIALEGVMEWDSGKYVCGLTQGQSSTL